MELVKAFQVNGVLYNSIAEMIRINQLQVKKLEEQYKEVIKRLDKICKHLEIKLDQKKVLLFEYSNFSNDKQFNLDNNSTNKIDNNSQMDTDASNTSDDENSNINNE